MPTTSGLIMTTRCPGSFPPEQSITNSRLGTPTWTAASPTPGAEYIVSNMLLTSFLRSSSKLVTGSPGASRIGFGQVTIFNKDIPKSLISDLEFHNPQFRMALIRSEHLDFTINVGVSLVSLAGTPA